MKITIVNTGGANLASICVALEKQGVETVISHSYDQIKNADKLILPGVSTADHAMALLADNKLIDTIQEFRRPVLGICLGMQLLFDYSHESFSQDSIDCLKIIPSGISKIPAKSGFPVPHMGWNSITKTTASPLLDGIEDNSYFYFVHSFYAPIIDETTSVTDYSLSLSATVQKNNFLGCQFHPEKSGLAGAKLLANFIKL